MKVTMVRTMAGPQGVAVRGTVLDLPKDQAEQMTAGSDAPARVYDPKRDAKAPEGFVTAPEKFA